MKKKDPSPLVFNGDGLIDVIATERQLAIQSSPEHEYVRQSNKRIREAKAAVARDLAILSQGAATTPAAGTSEESSFTRFNAARASREEENLAIVRMTRQEKEGTLLQKTEVANAAGALAQILLQGLDSFGVKAALNLAAESDPVACQSIIDSYIFQLRSDFCAKLKSLYPEIGNEING